MYSVFPCPSSSIRNRFAAEKRVIGNPFYMICC
jgi:hypothetical protein